jgi:hypothetical protein
MRIGLIAGAVGGGVEELFGLTSILHGRLPVLTHRVGVRMGRTAWGSAGKFVRARLVS